ncbi:MAG: hypothetical protein OEV44_15520 [Spirochaetota bacterium]|nr:hypothetical protein [Spirochaetota bacterium]
MCKRAIKRIVILTFIFSGTIFISINLFSMSLKMGLKGGVGLSHLQSDSGSTKDITVTNGGLAVEWVVSPNIALEVDLMHQQEGGIFSNGIQELNYWSFPVIIKVFEPFGKGNKTVFTPFLGIGGNFQHLYKAKRFRMTDNSVKKNNYKFLLTLGFKITPPIDSNLLDFSFEWRYEQGFEDVGTDRTMKTFSHQFLFGLMIKVF